MRRILLSMVSTLVLTWGLVGLPAHAGPPAECTIDFEGLPAGQPITALSVGSGISGCTIGGTVSVTSMNTLFPNPAAIVFDSANPTGGDTDLGSRNETCGGPGVGVGGEVGSPFENCVPLGKIAILAENMGDSEPNGLVDVPDDADVPGKYIFDFTDIRDKGVTIRSVTIMDVEMSQNENPAVVTLIRSNGPAAVFALVNTDDNGVAMFGNNGINVANVTQMEIEVLGSSGLVSAVFNTREVPGGDCWVTYGGFESAFNLDASGQKVFSFGGNVGPPPSGHLNIVAHNSGEHLRISGAEVTGCERIPALCDNSGNFPGPPSGNHNADAPNILRFVGTGILTNDTSEEVAVMGHMIDCGEPAGNSKKQNAQDQFRVDIVGGPHAGTFLDVKLDGGNVQLHGPVGPPQ